MEKLLPSFYSQYMESIPLLTKEEEIELSKDILGKNEKKKKIAINKLVSANIRLAVKIVTDDFIWFRDKQDLVSEAIIGLQKAASKYDYRFGAKFATYCSLYIRQYIIAHINKSYMIRPSNKMSSLYFHVQKVMETIESEKGREPKIEELEEILGMSKDRIDAIINYRINYVPLDAKFNEDSDKTISEIVEDESAIRPDKEAEKQNDFSEARDFFNGLNEREIFILKKRFGFDGEEPMILQDIGNMLNITRERVRQLQDMALKKIKKKLKKKNNPLQLNPVLA